VYLAAERQHPLLWQEPEPDALGLIVSRQALGGITPKVGGIQTLSRQLVHLHSTQTQRLYIKEVHKKCTLDDLCEIW
jgi:hypothetical protein